MVRQLFSETNYMGATIKYRIVRYVNYLLMEIVRYCVQNILTIHFSYAIICSKHKFQVILSVRNTAVRLVYFLKFNCFLYCVFLIGNRSFQKSMLLKFTIIQFKSRRKQSCVTFAGCERCLPFPVILFSPVEEEEMNEHTEELQGYSIQDAF